MNQEKKEYSILIVDDEKVNLDILNHILRPEYTIYVAKNGESALRRAAADRPDLILLDVLMPDMSGFEVLEKLKSSKETHSIPVIFITGLTGIEDEERGLFLGAVDYITKPFHNSIVTARVRTHIQIVRQMRTIERIGMIDALTEIPNRRSFDQRMRAEWGRSAREKLPLSLLMIDIDFFKKYNDTYGHNQGDLALQTVSRAIVSGLKRQSDFACRMGGEEFAVLLPNTDINGALFIGEAIRASVEAAKIPMGSGVEPTSCTVSVGAACTIPSPSDNMTELLERADSALYDAKRSGRNRVAAEPQG